MIFSDQEFSFRWSAGRAALRPVPLPREPVFYLPMTTSRGMQVGVSPEISLSFAADAGAGEKFQAARI